MTELLSRAMAMAIDDDPKDDSASTLDLNSIGSNEIEDVVSPEDVAWADSCLVSDLALLDRGMDSLKHALLDTFPSKTIFSSVMMVDSPQESHVFPPIEETGISGIVDNIIDDVSPTNTNNFMSRINSENEFLPISNEDVRLVEASDSEVDSQFSTLVEEELNDQVFKVWELDIPDEEDELVKQLQKALGGSFLDFGPSASENLFVLEDKLLDDIISGLDGLALSPITD